jgi:hypothetical protein
MGILNKIRGHLGVIALIGLIALLALVVYGLRTIEKKLDADGPKKVEVQRGDYNKLKDYLILIGESRAPWISRKEIAAWAAITLYLTIILLLLKKDELQRISPGKSSIALLFFSFFIGLFIHQQYGQIAYSMATQKTINMNIYRMSMDDSYLEGMNFDMNSNQPIPKFLADQINEQQKMIRQFSFQQRILLPFYKAYSWACCKNDSIQTVEVEEGLIYDIIILTLLFFLFTYGLKGRI